MNCKLDGDQGTLYLFSTCFVFSSLVQESYIVYWYDVTSMSLVDDTLLLNTITNTAPLKLQSTISFQLLVQQYEMFKSKKSQQLEFVLKTRKEAAWDTYFKKLFDQKCKITKECKLQRGFKFEPGRLFVSDKGLYFMTEQMISASDRESAIQIPLASADVKTRVSRLTGEGILQVNSRQQRYKFYGDIKQVGDLFK